MKSMRLHLNARALPGHQKIINVDITGPCTLWHGQRCEYNVTRINELP